MSKLRTGKGLMASVLGRMGSSEVLIDNNFSNSMLVGLLQEAERVEDADAAWAEVRAEVAAAWGWDDEEGPARKPFLYRDGVAIIPVHGILINRFSYCWGFVTGYDFIRSQLDAAEDDPDVKLIVYDHDSPGGEAPGCDECARDIREGKKPSIAIVNALSASASFWVAVAADRVVAAPSSSVGSIGVYILHMSFLRMLQEFGVDPEYIQAGKFKTSGSPYKELDDKDREYLQGLVDERMDEFVAAVAEFRSVEESVARGTEARVLRPPEAISLGLIDAAVAPSKAVADYVAELGGNDPESDEEDENMADQTSTTELTNEQRREIAQAEQARIKGIVTNDEAKGREDLANHLAYDTSMEVEAAVAILAKAPKAEAGGEDGGESDDKADDKPVNDGGDDKPDDEQADDKPADDGKGEKGKGKSHFENAMDKGGHPDAGGGGNDGDDKASGVDALTASYEAATGMKLGGKK